MIMKNSFFISRQQGSALIIGMVFLIVLTILGIASMQGTTMQERMAGNYRETNESLQAAEAALRVAERLILSEDATTLNNAYNALDPGDAPVWVTLDTATQGTYPGAQPRYTVEVLHPYSSSLAADAPLPEPQYYRVTAIGTSASTQIQSTIETTVKIR